MFVELDNVKLKASEGKRYGALRVEIVRDIGSLETAAGAWNRLALAAPQRLPMLSHAWVAAYLTHRLAPRETWRCALAYDADALVGVLCVVVTPHRLLGRWFPRLRAPHDSHTRSGDALLAEGREVEIFQALLVALRRSVPGCLSVELRGVRAGSPVFAALEGGMRKSVVVRADGDYGSFVRVASTFEDFQSRLSDNFLGNLRKARNKLAKLPGVQTEFLTGEHATAEHFGRFAEVEASGWKGRKGTALGASPALVAFYTALSSRLAQEGWLEWHFLNGDGKTLAGHLGLRFGRSMVLLKIGYDEAYAKCGPGNLLFDHTVRRVFEHGDIDEINCLTDMPWHLSWRMDRSDYASLWIYPKQPLALLFGALPTWTALRVKRALRPLVEQLRQAIKRRRRAARRTEVESA